MYSQPMQTFQINDYIFHGGSGVCRVQDICVPNARRADPSKTYYRLQPLYDKGSVIYTPTDSSSAIVRKILSRAEALRMIHELPRLEAIWVDNEKNRELKFREVLRTNDCREWMRVIKTLYQRSEERRQEGKRISQTDEKYLRLAEDLLYGELAVSLGIPKDQVGGFIAEHVLGQEERRA